jgi:hypothetical protein
MDLEPSALNDRTILRYLGYRNQTLTEDILQQLSQSKIRICAAALPRTVYRAFSLKDGHIFGAELQLEGASIKTHLAGSHQIILMAATLGPNVDKLLLQMQVRNLSDALMMDACASAAIEEVCDGLETQLQGDYRQRGLYLTDRFSPGYGDFPLCIQGQFCSVLDTQRRIGLSVTKTNILTPRKSVTAVIGISKTPRPRRGGCEDCALFHTCAYRKDGTICGA